MENTSLNRQALERIARTLFNIQDPEVIDAFINEFVYSALFY